MSTMPPGEWDLMEALVDAIAFQTPRDGAEEIIKEVLTDRKYQREILRILGFPEKVHIWHDSFGDIWYCDQYDHGPMCRLCRKMN